MKKTTALLCVVLTVALWSAVVAHGYGAELTAAEVSLAFTPPHNEPVIGDYVARYKIEGNAGVRVWRFTLDTDVKAWFLQDWRPPNVVGHGFPTAWRNSDWGFEKARIDYNAKLGFDLFGGWQAFVEHNRWSIIEEDRHDYYWMTGFRYILQGGGRRQ